MKIKSIYIDGLHNAVNKTYTFGDIVYIFGNNGIGKSTILQAIQLALLGYIPGTAKNSKEALLRHSPTGKITVSITLLDDQQDEVFGLTQAKIITRTISVAGNKLETVPVGYDITTILKDIEIPIFNFNEFVSQTANKLKEYFIKNILPTTQGTLDWHKILEDSIQTCNFTDKDAILDYGMSLIGNLDGEILDQVIQANTKFKEEQSFNKSELTRLQNTINSLIYYDDYVGPTNLEEINSQLLSLGILRDELISYNSAMDATKSSQEELHKLEEQLEYLGGKTGYENLQSKLEILKAKYSEVSNVTTEIQQKLTAFRTKDAEATSIIKSNGVCPYTKDTCKTMVSKVEDLRNETVKYKAAIVTLTETLDAKNKELNDINLNIRKCESGISDFLKIWGRLETLQKVTSNLPPKPDTDKTVYDLNGEIEELNKSKSKLEANIYYNNTINHITKLKYDMELQNKALACWVTTTDTNGLQTTLMQKPFESLAATMTEYIQQMYGISELKAHFNVTSKSNSFSFGLIREGVYIPYDLLSSGEKCLYALALMICIVNKSTSPLKVLLLDDAFDHLDQNAIENTFATLKNVKDIQFIFVGVKHCDNAKDIVLTV